MLTVIVILTALNALAFTVRASVRIESSGAESLSASARLDTRPKKCPDARKGLRYYRSQRAAWDRKRTGHRDTGGGKLENPRLCKRVRELVTLARLNARQARKRYERWWEYHYHWQAWLPDKWARIGACETGYGQRPGNWRHSNSSYEGAFGFAKSSWDAFKYRADPKAGPYPADAWMATPRQQYEVALAIWRAYGFSGWGCRGA